MGTSMTREEPGAVIKESITTPQGTRLRVRFALLVDLVALDLTIHY